MDIQPVPILFQILNFSVVFFVFTKFLFKPILKVLDDRAAKVKDGLQAAEKNVKLQKQLEDEKTKLLKDAKAEAQKIVKDANSTAEQVLKDAKAKAKVEAKDVLAKERSAFESQMSQQQADFKADMAKTIDLATNAVLKEVVNVKVQKDIIDKQIKQLNIQL